MADVALMTDHRPLSEKLWNFQRDGEFCDLSVQAADGTTIRVHSAVVATASDMLKTAVLASLPSTGQAVIHLPWLETEGHLQIFLHRLYFGHVETRTTSSVDVSQHPAVPVMNRTAGDPNRVVSTDSERSTAREIFGEIPHLVSPQEILEQHQRAECSDVSHTEKATPQIGALNDVIDRKSSTTSAEKPERVSGFEYQNAYFSSNQQNDCKEICRRKGEKLNVESRGTEQEMSPGKDSLEADQQITKRDALIMERVPAENGSLSKQNNLETYTSVRMKSLSRELPAHTEEESSIGKGTAKTTNNREFCNVQQNGPAVLDSTPGPSNVVPTDKKSTVSLPTTLGHNISQSAAHIDLQSRPEQAGISDTGHCTKRGGPNTYRCDKNLHILKHSKHLKDHQKSCHSQEDMTRPRSFHCQNQEPVSAPALPPSLRGTHQSFSHPQLDAREEGCGYRTAFKSCLKRHCNQKHQKEKLICEICGGLYSSVPALNVHIGSVHGDTREEHFCDICSKRFCRKQALLQHKLRVHEKVRKYLCDQCPYMGFDKPSLTYHLFRHHGASLPGDINGYSCPHCEYQTPVKTHLSDHLERHGDQKYSCELCGCVFSASRNLKIHMKKHTDEQRKAYPCPYKTCKFVSKYGPQRLKDHINRMHERRNYKPWACQLCDYRTNIKGNLTLHQRKVHKV